MKFKKNLKNQKWFAYTVAVCSGVILYLALTNISTFLGWIGALLTLLSPVIEGVAIAYILHPVCRLLEKKVFYKLKSEYIAHLVSVAVTAVLVILLLVILSVALVPQIMASILSLIDNAGNYLRELQNMLSWVTKFARDRGVDVSPAVDATYAFGSDLISSLPDRMNRVIEASYNLSMALGNAVLAFVLAIYFLMDAKELLGGVRRLSRAFMMPKNYKKFIAFWSQCNQILIKYITFDIVDGFIIAFLNFIFMLIAGMPYAVLVSVVVGITNLAPTFGPIVGGMIGAFILVLDSPWDALGFVIFALVVQTVDAYVIKPRLFGTSLGVPAVWILVTIILGGKLFGVLGIVLAIPFAAIVNYIYRDMLEKRLEEQEQKQIVKQKAAEAEKERENNL